MIVRAKIALGLSLFSTAGVLPDRLTPDHFQFSISSGEDE
jgi:hypothetical protein